MIINDIKTKIKKDGIEYYVNEKMYKVEYSNVWSMPTVTLKQVNPTYEIIHQVDINGILTRKTVDDYMKYGHNLMLNYLNNGKLTY